MSKLGILFLVGITALILLSSRSQIKSNNLFNEQRAEAFIQFEKWIQKYSKNYRQLQEKNYRFAKFLENRLFVKAHNMKYEKGQQTFTVELNQFADLDNIEFKSLYTGLKKKEVKNRGITNDCRGKIDILDNPPESVDWDGKVISSVKNQGACGSCWAFSSVGAIQGLKALSSGSIVDYSEQQLVDCAGGPYQNQGCDGGDMVNAFWYVIDNGITTAAKYPYKAQDQKCIYKDTMKEFQIKGCARVPANKTLALQSAVLKQPVSISVEADGLRWQLYKSGVFSKKCGIDLDHGILLAGYGSLKGQNYWKCKNSWGSGWGMNGYILLARGEDGPGQCGILIDNSVPLL